MSKILLVEDDKVLAEMVTDWLTHEHYQVDCLHSGRDGLDRLKFYSYDLVILDWDLPELSGIDILKEYRDKGGATPVLMLTGKSTVDEKLVGLDSGADDYLTKPFHMKELSARLRSLLRRPQAMHANLLKARNLELDATLYRVTKDGVEIELLPKEFALLEFLMRHPNQVFSAEALLDRVWKADSDATTEAIRSCFKRLRKKIDVDDGEPILKNVHGVGYKLQA